MDSAVLHFFADELEKLASDNRRKRHGYYTQQEQDPAAAEAVPCEKQSFDCAASEDVSSQGKGGCPKAA